MTLTTSTYLLLTGAALALVYARIKTRWISKQPVDSPELKRIGGYISDGAMAFMRREFSVLLPFVLIVAAFLWIGNPGTLRLQSIAFLFGAAASGTAGYTGMRVAVGTNTRTTYAAQGGVNTALKVSFSGGSVMGLTVVGLAMLGIGVLLLVLTSALGTGADILGATVLPIVSGFSLGASSVALFARVGGGIFTKAADVGADLVGKVEAGIPEDDHRNPATIADNVGDNVGDVAGMGADLFESYVGSLLGVMILGVGFEGTESIRLQLAALPMVFAAIGVVASIIGIASVRVKEGRSPQSGLNRGTIIATLIAATVTVITSVVILGDGNGSVTGIAVASAAVIGMVAGAAIGLLTEYFTGTDTGPTRRIVRSCQTGPATTIITGVGVGMLSAFPPIIIIGAAIFSGNALVGLYGIGIAALGMLMTLGIQLAVDAYGPIADNAGGLAEMASFPPEVRKITDELDAVGNTTAAIGKGFAIGSAALTAIILFTAVRQQLGVAEIDLLDVGVIGGILLGAAVPYLFSSMAMDAIGDAAYTMIEEVRRQFRERPGILDETEEPDYRRCVDISTASALKKMMLPGIVAAVTPVLVGFVGGVNMLMGLLIGVTASGVVLAIFMSNAGGAWDNAKKMIEGGDGGGKYSDAHRAAVVGDTVGDPFKDTAGPSLNILIKLMAIVSLVIAPMLRSFWGI